jgi:hypothetical protein
MAIVIDSGPIDAQDKLQDVPKEKWRDLMLARKSFMEIRLSHDCRCLVEFVDDAAIMFKELGFASVHDMVREGYDLEPEEIAVAVEWLRLNPDNVPRSLERVQNLAGWGGDRRSEKAKDQDRVPTLKTRGRAYDLARLKRDRPDLAEKVIAGELSANAAAIEAGFRKKPTRKATCPNCGCVFRS